MEVKILNMMATEKSALIVGRGGFHLLKGHPVLANVFSHASIDFRIKRVMEIYKMKEKREARSLIDESDPERGKYLRITTGAEWTDSRNYQLCMDISRVDFSAAEQMMVELIECIKRKLG